MNTYVSWFFFLTVVTTGCAPTSPSSPTSQGLEGGPCNQDLTCTGNLICVDGKTCQPPLDAGENQTMATESDHATDDQGETHGDEWTEDEAIVASSNILCQHLVACFGEDYIQFDDCLDQQISGSNTNECVGFNASRVQPCILCLEERIACPEIEGMILQGYPLGTYCPICDEICDS